jgi:hypothetical protein
MLNVFWYNVAAFSVALVVIANLLHDLRLVRPSKFSRIFYRESLLLVFRESKLNGFIDLLLWPLATLLFVWATPPHPQQAIGANVLLALLCTWIALRLIFCLWAIVNQRKLPRL